VPVERNARIVMMAIIPELSLVSRNTSSHEDFGAYKVPKLMAIPTPIFSDLSICKPQIVFHERSTRAKSTKADHAVVCQYSNKRSTNRLVLPMGKAP
jgi:hypothetical protein